MAIELTVGALKAELSALLLGKSGQHLRCSRANVVPPSVVWPSLPLPLMVKCGGDGECCSRWAWV